MWSDVCKFLLLAAICIKGNFSTPVSTETPENAYEEIFGIHTLLALTSVQTYLKNYCINELDSCSSNPIDINFENTTNTDLQLNLLNYVLINNMSEILNKMISDEKEKGLPERCIEAIQSHDMEEAVQILSSFKKNNRINLVINRVYEHNILNFENVFNFCISINDEEKSKIAFDALYYELKNSGHFPIENIEKVRNKINSFEVSSVTKAYIVEFIGKIYNELLEAQIGTMIHQKNETDTVLDYIKSLKFKNMKFVAFKILLQKMKEDKFEHGSILQVAYQLNKILQNKSYAGITESKDVSKAEEMLLDITDSEDQSEKLMGLLPKCIKNIVSSEDIYIKNPLYNEYLYASDVKQWGNGNLRHVFTWVPLNASCHTFDKVWSVEFVENGKKVMLTNKKYRDTLYVSHNYGFNNDKENQRSVNIGSRKLYNLDNDGRARFILKPVGDECIMLTAAGSTVYVSKETYDGENRLVVGKSSSVDIDDNSTHMMFEAA